MRIAVVVRSLKLGGMERAAVNLAEAFAAAGHDTHLIHLKAPRELAPDAAVHLHRFDLDRQMRRSVPGLAWELFSRLCNILVRRSYFLLSGLYLSRLFAENLAALERSAGGTFDLVIARGQGTFEVLWALDDPRFVEVVESMFVLPGSRLKNFYLRRLYDGKRVVCVSRGVRQRFEATAAAAGFSPASVDVITNPVDIESVRRLADAEPVPASAPYLLSVGRITPNKNLALLIDAYRLLRVSVPDTPPLVIVGDGHGRAAIEAKIAAESLQPYIRLVGKRNNPYPWMKHAELFVLSSRFEGLGMVLIEAMACGTRVVAAKAPGGVFDIMTPELESFLAEPKPESLAEVMRRALDADVPDYTAVLERFRPETIVKQWIGTFLTPDAPGS